jgi:hypothetical protein
MTVADFGVLVVETDIDRALIKTLRMWLPRYIAELERERADVLQGQRIARPEQASYQNVLEDDDFPDGSLPAILVTTASPSQVERYSDERYAAQWTTRVSAVVRGKTGAEAREVAALYAGSVRRILVDQPFEDLEGRCFWVPGGGVQPVADETDKGRYLAAGISQFDVIVDEVLGGSGPVLPTPDDPPYPDLDPDPDVPFDPLAVVTGVTTTITARS